MRKTLISFLLLFVFSCQHHIQTADRPELGADTNTSQDSDRSFKLANKLSDKDLEKYAYELGFDPAAGLTADEKKAVYNRRQVRQLERAIETDKEKTHYSKVLPFFETDEEKIKYLSIPSIEGRQAWTNRNKIWSRAKPDKDFEDMVDSQDISVGMTETLVRKAWGEPQGVDNSGNAVYKNVRWKYIRDVASPSGYKRERRYVYFEGGRVVGWETE